MGAPLEICRKRTVCAVLASGVVISLTALTGGVAPAFAKPGDDPVVPTTTIVPAPPAEVTQAPAEKPVEQPTAADIPSPAAPAVVVPSAAPAVEAPPVQQSVVAPAPTRASEPVAPSSAPAAPPAQREAPPSSPPPVTTTTKSATTSAPVTSAAPPPSAPPSASLAPAPASETSSASSGSAAPKSEPSSANSSSASSAPESSSAASSSAASSSETSAPESESARNGSGSSSSSASSSASDATPKVIAKVAPQTLEAPEADVQLAKSAAVVEAKPVEAPKQEIADIARIIDVPGRDKDQSDRNGQRNDQRNDDNVQLAGNWDRNVRQWRPDWVEYDDYYRPVLSNPYRDPVRIVYVYQNAPRVAFIPPLGRIVLEVAQFAAYSFTALVTNPVNEVLNVAVGSFFGGGYDPGVGLPLPPPPPPLLNYANVPVQVRYPDATYQPFRVNKIVDVGPDAQYGEQKVLLDGVTPAWGEWKQGPSGERSFEVHKTQQFPGLDDPRPGPLPGDYQLTLASDESPSGMTKRDVYLIAVAVACGALSIGAVVLAVFMGRRRRPLH